MEHILFRAIWSFWCVKHTIMVLFLLVFLLRCLCFYHCFCSTFFGCKIQKQYHWFKEVLLYIHCIYILFGYMIFSPNLVLVCSLTSWYPLMLQFSSVTQSCPTLRPHEPQHARPLCPSPTPGVHPNQCPSSRWCHLILCHPLLLLPSIFPSIRIFSNESALPIRWPKYWSFSLNLSPSNKHPGLISFRMDWLDLLVVQGVVKSLLQHHSSKASVLQCSAFFIVQL